MPLLLILCLKREVCWKNLLFIPAAYVVTVLPAWFEGRPLGDLLTIYLSQFDTYHRLTLNAPNPYQWLPVVDNDLIAYAGLVVMAALVSIFILLAWKSPTKVTPSPTIHLALISSLIVPFLLPRMHERYFLPGDVLSIVFAFYFPKFAFVSIEILLGSLISYHPFLFGPEGVPLSWVAFALLACIILLLQHLVTMLYPRLSFWPLRSSLDTRVS